MKATEFLEKLDNAITVDQIAKLRRETRASKFVSLCKDKIRARALIEGYEVLSVSISTLKSLTVNTDCGQFFEFQVPEKNRTFAKYKNVRGYVNSKEGTKFQTVEIFVKEN